MTLFKRLSTAKSIALEPALIECLVKESECFKLWKMHYKKNMMESNILVSYIGMLQILSFKYLQFNPIMIRFVFPIVITARNWTNLPVSIKQNSNLKDFLGYIHLQNGSFKQQDQQLHDEICKSVQLIQVSQ